MLARKYTRRSFLPLIALGGTGFLMGISPLEAIAGEPGEKPRDVDVFGIGRKEYEGTQALEPYSLENFEQEWRLYHSNHPTRIIIASEHLREAYP